MSSDTQAPQSIQTLPISGEWVNQRGKKVKFTAHQDGSLTGDYHYISGKGTRIYPLTGRFDPYAPQGKGASLGWTVTWRDVSINARFTTTWSGQYFASPTPRIVTQWLGTQSTEAKSVWNSTNLGHDEFTPVDASTA